jgi:hypothetical protein
MPGGQEEEVMMPTNEIMFRVEPDGWPLSLEEGVCGGTRSPESLAAAEARLSAVGFEKRVEGRIVSYRRDVPPFVLFADPRKEGKLEIATHHQDPVRGRGKVKLVAIPDAWWESESDPARRFAEFVEKNFPQPAG